MSEATAGDRPAHRGERFTRGSRLAALASRAGLAFAILAIVAYGSTASPSFLTVGNFLNVLTSMAIVGIVVVGMTFVLVVGGLADLSVPATTACGAILSLALQPFCGSAAAFALAVALAGSIGLLNGVLIGYCGVNPIIVTLGIGTIALGVVQAAVGGVIVYGTDPRAAALLKGHLLGVPVVVYAFVATAVLGDFVLSRSFWGRWTVATGGNNRAAEASAVPVRATKAGAFVITAIASGISGGLLGLTLQSARPAVGAGYEFSAITAVVVGGVSILGGSGSVLRALSGLVFVQLLTNVMVLEGVRTPVQGFVLGVLIAGAVALDVALRARAVL